MSAKFLTKWAFSPLFLTLTLSLSQAATAAEAWDVNAPQGEFKEIKISTTEGTWMNLDMSPDGKFIVFDLLGDIYRIPASGGDAEL